MSRSRHRRGLVPIAGFDVDAVVTAIRRDQRGESTYDEFMAAIWEASTVHYDSDLVERTCTYHGLDARVDVYVEDYPHVLLDPDRLTTSD